MSRPHLSWPLCGDCGSYGVYQTGSGHEPGQTCSTCLGVGRTEPRGWKDTVTEACRFCRGAGCEKCGGTGIVITRKGTIYYMEYEGMTLADALKAMGGKAAPEPGPIPEPEPKKGKG